MTASMGTTKSVRRLDVLNVSGRRYDAMLSECAHGLLAIRVDPSCNGLHQTADRQRRDGIRQSRYSREA